MFNKKTIIDNELNVYTIILLQIMNNTVYYYFMNTEIKIFVWDKLYFYNTQKWLNNLSIWNWYDFSN